MINKLNVYYYRLGRRSRVWPN